MKIQPNPLKIFKQMQVLILRGQTKCLEAFVLTRRLLCSCLLQLFCIPSCSAGVCSWETAQVRRLDGFGVPAPLPTSAASPGCAQGMLGPSGRDTSLPLCYLSCCKGQHGLSNALVSLQSPRTLNCWVKLLQRLLQPAPVQLDGRETSVNMILVSLRS